MDMPQRDKINTIGMGIMAILIVILVGFLTYKQWFSANKLIIFNPAGIIALKERNLMILATLLMLIVVIPVFIFTFYIVWKYRATKDPRKYDPNWDHNPLIETIWWGVPIIIIAILSVITWRSSYDLSPYKSLASNVKSLEVQVVALDWKWLFIYPEQGIATVNYLEMPEGTPVDFKVTSDAPMNSFWIPQLGGQIYGMPGMSTELHLEASATGTYDGYSANISGVGFAGMKFKAVSVAPADFESWAIAARQTPNVLDLNEYNRLAMPSQNDPVATYVLTDQNLYNETIMKFMTPEGKSEISSTSSTSSMMSMPDGTVMNMNDMPGSR